MHPLDSLRNEINESSFTAWPSCTKERLISMSLLVLMLGLPIKFMILIGGHEIIGAVIENHIILTWAPGPVCEVKMSPDRTG